MLGQRWAQSEAGGIWRRSRTQSRVWICSACRSAVRPPKVLVRRLHDHQRTSLQQLPSKPARTRFAPSPTGSLHLGSLRTALYNYLLARATGGQFILRIEDTDQKRIVPGAVEQLCGDLKWAGLQWDEGPDVGGEYGPYEQSKRTPLYHEHVENLLASGHAYRCFCTPERLTQLAAQRSAHGSPSTEYDRACLHKSREQVEELVSTGERHTIRLKVPDKYPEYRDIVYGRVGKSATIPKRQIGGQPAFEDPILLKSDGHPTYHLANVVDDHCMQITHVLRAAEWMTSTPKHLALYDAFGWAPPAFAHVGLLQDMDGQKLSKRRQDTSFATFQEQGVLPSALLNFVALLGWSHRQPSDVMNLQQLTENFDMKFTKGNTVVNLRKLNFLMTEHVKLHAEAQNASFQTMIDRVLAELAHQHAKGEALFLPRGREPRSYLSLLLKADSKNYFPPAEFLQRNRAFFQARFAKREESLPIEDLALLDRLEIALASIPHNQWTDASLKAAQERVVDEYMQQAISGSSEASANLSETLPNRKSVSIRLFKAIRSALLGTPAGLPVLATMSILGADVVLFRLRVAMQREQESDEATLFEPWQPES